MGEIPVDERDQKNLTSLRNSQTIFVSQVGTISLDKQRNTLALNLMLNNTLALNLMSPFR